MDDSNKVLFDSPAKVDELSHRINRFIWTRLLETSASFKALPPEVITVNEMTRNVHGDLVKMINIEPGSTEPVIQGDPDLNGRRGTRVEIPLVRFESPWYKGDVGDQLGPRFTRIIEDSICRPMSKALDHAFFKLCKIAAEKSGNAQKVHRGASGKDILRHGFNSIDRNRLSSYMTVCGKDFHNKIHEGGPATEGPKQFGEAIMGKQFVVSINQDLFKDDIYFFSAPKYQGKNYIMDTMQFNIDQKFSKIEFDFHLDQALALINTAAVGVVTLVD